MTVNKMKPVLAIALAVGMNGTAQAMLWDRGGGLIYDDVLKVTWLQDANYAASELNYPRQSRGPIG